MKFIPTEISGVWIVDLERHEDERGSFARTWCAAEFAKHGLNPRLAQCSASFNKKKGTLRGMHYQAVPHEEAKLVRCTRGAIFDVALDLRANLPTFKRWVGVELSAGNGRALYIPEGCAHGFQTLEDNTEVFYQMTEPFHPEAVRGVRWNDPQFGVQWPIFDPIISDRDRNLPLFTAEL